jgi:hypothetical protein
MSVHHPSRPIAVRRAVSTAERVERTAGFEILARAGFAARAAIYGIIGILAIKLAIGSGGKTTDQTGALKTIAHQPFGKVLLVLAAIGLGGYSLWRLTHALLGHGPEKSDSGLDRLAALGSGTAYGVVCAIAVEILLGAGTSSHRAPKATGGLLGWPGGMWIVGLAGAIFIGVGLYQGYRALTKDFLKDSKTEEMSPAMRRWFKLLATLGHLSRMVVSILVGSFLIKAAVDFNPNKAVGLDGALAKVANQSYGSLLLGVVAAGLIAFALYSLADVRYRRI